MRKKILYIIITAIVLVIIGLTLSITLQIRSDRKVDYDYEEDVNSVSSYTKVLRVAGGTDFSPFCYLDESGNPCGHDVELAFALGREMGYKVEITLGSWANMQNGILTDTYDLLLTVDYSDYRSTVMGYSSPICIDNYVFFGNENKISEDDVNDLQKLKTLRIASLKSGGATDNYIVPMGLESQTTYYASQEEAFESVLNGENDVAIAGYIYGTHIIGEKEYALKQVGNALYQAAYYFTYDIENTTLGLELNQALATLESNGTLDEISEKWIERYQPSFSIGDYFKENILKVIVIILFIVIIIILSIQYILNRMRKKEQEILEKNPLTGLYNMRSFLSHMKEYILKNEDKKFALIRFDIDNFKSFNGTQGVEVGDQLLKNIGSAIDPDKISSREILLSGYLGADHFIMLVEYGPTTNNPDLLYDYISGVVKNACPGIFITIRMSLCRIIDTSGDLSQYLDRTQIALRTLKNNYYRYWTWFDDTVQKALDEEKLINEKMFDALKQGRFVPYFQPQYDYGTGKMIGAEVLARWIDTDGSIISPGVFIPIFERNGFIYEMDKSIWNSIVLIINKWKTEGIMPPHLSINISRADLYHSDLFNTIKNLVLDNKINIKLLHIEITESSYIENKGLLIDLVNNLKSIGAIVEMDDFGSGYSSLASLKDINVDAIKIDMSLVKNNTLVGKDATILSSVIQLGKNMGLDIIAEGVEGRSQAEFLYQQGCNKMQGYMFSKPLNQATFEEMLRKTYKKN